MFLGGAYSLKKMLPKQSRYNKLTRDQLLTKIDNLMKYKSDDYTVDSGLKRKADKGYVAYVYRNLKKHVKTKNNNPVEEKKGYMTSNMPFVQPVIQTVASLTQTPVDYPQNEPDEDPEIEQKNDEEKLYKDTQKEFYDIFNSNYINLGYFIKQSIVDVYNERLGVIKMNKKYFDKEYNKNSVSFAAEFVAKNKLNVGDIVRKFNEYNDTFVNNDIIEDPEIIEIERVLDERLYIKRTFDDPKKDKLLIKAVQTVARNKKLSSLLYENYINYLNPAKLLNFIDKYNLPISEIKNIMDKYESSSIQRGEPPPSMQRSPIEEKEEINIEENAKKNKKTEKKKKPKKENNILKQLEENDIEEIAKKNKKTEKKKKPKKEETKTKKEENMVQLYKNNSYEIILSIFNNTFVTKSKIKNLLKIIKILSKKYNLDDINDLYKIISSKLKNMSESQFLEQRITSILMPMYTYVINNNIPVSEIIEQYGVKDYKIFEKINEEYVKHYKQLGPPPSEDIAKFINDRDEIKDIEDEIYKYRRKEKKTYKKRQKKYTKAQERMKEYEKKRDLYEETKNQEEKKEPTPKKKVKNQKIKEVDGIIYKTHIEETKEEIKPDLSIKQSDLSNESLPYLQFWINGQEHYISSMNINKYEKYNIKDMILRIERNLLKIEKSKEKLKKETKQIMVSTSDNKKQSLYNHIKDINNIFVDDLIYNESQYRQDLYNDDFHIIFQYMKIYNPADMYADIPFKIDPQSIINLYNTVKSTYTNVYEILNN
jgi:hypothetical protein